MSCVHSAAIQCSKKKKKLLNTHTLLKSLEFKYISGKISQYLVLVTKRRALFGK